MSHVSEFDRLIADLPPDWALMDFFVTLDDAADLTEARIALSRANARPLYGPGDHDFAITVAHTHGRGAHVGVARSALQLLDELGIAGRTWGGDATSSQRPAPAHRAGP